MAGYSKESLAFATGGPVARTVADLPNRADGCRAGCGCSGRSSEVPNGVGAGLPLKQDTPS